jgi:hypothetical protein
MENANEILKELKGISSLVAGIKKVNVFTVPEGYFNSISDTVMLSIDENFSIAETHLNKEDVPAGYFENLSASILDKIKKQETSELPEIFSTLKKETLFQVLANYFETLPDAILKKINTDQDYSESLSEVLVNLKRVQPFTVPANYFSELPANILKKIQQPQEAKVVTMPGRFSVLKYAAAAVIIGGLALGVYKYSNQPKVEETTNVAMDPSIEKGKVMDDKKFTETLNNLSADEIVNYLQRNSSESDIAVLRSNVDDKSLPNEEDYLLDDKTLDNFLKEIESKTN